MLPALQRPAMAFGGAGANKVALHVAKVAELVGWLKGAKPITTNPPHLETMVSLHSTHPIVRIRAKVVLKRIRMVLCGAHPLCFPAEAGIYVCHGHRPSPVWAKKKHPVR